MPRNEFENVASRYLTGDQMSRIRSEARETERWHESCDRAVNDAIDREYEERHAHDDDDH